jgi:protein-tyrosine phosphatase
LSTALSPQRKHLYKPSGADGFAIAASLVLNQRWNESLYMNIVLFLCTGNYYRSRFAEEFFNFLAPVECPGWTAASRGLAVELGVNNIGPIAQSTAKALEQRGITFVSSPPRMPLQLKIGDLESADHIVALKKAEHFPLMQQRFPSWLATYDRTRLEFWGVHDIDRMTPEEAIPLIAEGVHGLTKRLSAKNQCT